MVSSPEEDPEQNNSAAPANTGCDQSRSQSEAVADKVCSICMSEATNSAYIDGCFHAFCFSCIQRWAAVRVLCPLRRQPFNCVLHTVRADDNCQRYVVVSSTPQRRPVQERELIRFLQPRYCLRPRLFAKNQPIMGRRRPAWRH